LKSAFVKVIDDSAASLAGLFDKIRDDSRDGEGVTRDAFGPRETQAARTVEIFAHSRGLQTAYDHGGNLHIVRPGQIDKPPEILVASHLDSVPVGGNYDGLAGVIAGVAVLSALKDEPATANTVLRGIGFRGEESPWFSQAYLGSKLLLGEFSHADLDALRRFDTGKTLAEHIAGLGITLPRGKIPPAIPLDRLMAYFELHIEQAPLLENLGRPLGVASAIRGNIRYPFAKCFGHYAHSGAVPRQFRQDALIAGARLIAFADERWQQLIDAGNDDLVFTCGIFQTDSAEHTMTKVPGEITFTLNIGSTSNGVMEDMQNSIAACARELERECSVRFDFGKRVGTPAVDLDRNLMSLVETAGQEIGIAPHRMPTVGHDAAMFQRRGIPASVLLIRNANGSHNPKESMEMSDFIAGTKVLASTIYNMCRS
jgi:N-carbamoyl-L-amino-acid hydrolase